MIDHVSIGVSDLDAAALRYERILAPLGLALLVRRERTVGFGKRYPEFWLNHRDSLGTRARDTGWHVCLRAADESTVREFHAAALAAGCSDAGRPGPRPGQVTRYFAAFIEDHDGNRIEVASFPTA